MANAFYDLGIEKFLNGSISYNSDTIKALLVDAGMYTPNMSTDEFLSDVPSGARIGTAVALASKTTAAGVADAADTTITAVTGATVEYVLIYKDTGTAGTSSLIALYDTGSGLPFTPNGGDVTIVWDNGGNKIFKL